MNPCSVEVHLGSSLGFDRSFFHIRYWGDLLMHRSAVAGLGDRTYHMCENYVAARFEWCEQREPHGHAVGWTHRD